MWLGADAVACVSVPGMEETHDHPPARTTNDMTQFEEHIWRPATDLEPLLAKEAEFQYSEYADQIAADCPRVEFLFGDRSFGRWRYMARFTPGGGYAYPVMIDDDPAPWDFCAPVRTPRISWDLQYPGEPLSLHEWAYNPSWVEDGHLTDAAKDAYVCAQARAGDTLHYPAELKHAADLVTRLNALQPF